MDPRSGVIERTSFGVCLMFGAASLTGIILITWTQLIVSSLLVVLSWFIAHSLTSRRDAANRRREIQVAALRSLYMTLSNANRREHTEEIGRDVESLVS